MSKKEIKEEYTKYPEPKKGLFDSLKTAFTQEKVEPQIPIHMKVSKLLAERKD